MNGSINSSRPQPKKRGTNLWSKKLNVEADGTILEGESSSDDAFSRAGTTPSRPLAMRRGTGWNNLKLKLKLGGLKDLELPAGVGGSSSLTTELAMGLLPMVMIKMARLDRDDHDKKRIPVLMNFIKLSITSSTKSHSERHTSFRIELEYGDGLLKWVIYRELKDFVALHTHCELLASSL